MRREETKGARRGTKDARESPSKDKRKGMLQTKKKKKKVPGKGLGKPGLAA